MFSRSTTLPIQMLNIEDDGFHLIISAMINDKPANLLVDTGASRTVFDKEKILQYIGEHEFEEHDKLSTGLGTDSMPTSSASLARLTLGKIMVKDFQAILLDLSHVNASYEKMGFLMIDGVLGSDLLHKHKAEINYHKLTLKLYR